MSDEALRNTKYASKEVQDLTGVGLEDTLWNYFLMGIQFIGICVLGFQFTGIQIPFLYNIYPI